MLKIKTASDLKYHVEQTGSHFFDRKTMRLFGDTMANYGVRRTTIDTPTGKNVDVYELYRRRPTKFGTNSSAYFRVDDFTQVFHLRRDK